MKVLFVCSGNSHYGIVPFVKSQGESLKTKGVELEYFAVIGKGFIGYLKNIRHLKNKIRSKEIEIIHSHYGLTGLLCFLTFTKIPIILSIMGGDAYGSFNSKGKRTKFSYLEILLTQIALIFSKQIIVKSKSILRYIPHKNKSHIIPNGVDFDLFKPNSCSLQSNYILFLGDSQDPRKNYDLAKKAFKLINKKEIKLINPYPIEHLQVPQYLNKSSVLILTSYQEGSPNIIKEAMACNIPIVSTDVGDVKGIISKTAGCYISSFKPKDFAQKIEKALNYGKRTSGRQDVLHLELNMVAEKIIDIYKKTLRK